MSLELLALQLEHKGFTRQATLMRTTYGRIYLTALLQPRWRDQVKNAFGEELYDQMNEFRKAHPQVQDLLMIIADGSEPFCPKDYSPLPLEVKIEQVFDFPTLQKTAETVSNAAHLVSRAMAPIYREIVLQTKDNEELLYEVYKDTDTVPEHEPTLEERRELENEYRERLLSCVPRLKRLAEHSDAPTFTILQEIHLISRYLPKEEMEKFFNYDRQKDVQEWFEQDYGGNEKQLRADAIKLAQRGKEILNSPEQFSAMTLSLTKQNQENKRERMLREADHQLGYLAIYAAVPYEESEAMGGLADCFNPFNPFELYADLWMQNYQDAYQFEASIGFSPSDEEQCRKALQEKGLAALCADALQRLYKSPLKARQEFLEHKFNPALQHLLNTQAGLQQLAEGGTITNPQAAAVSVVQNHAHLPNLSYSAETRQTLAEILKQLTPLLSDIPDISDLPASDKLRNKKELTYVMRELPKDPLDVTFGNDSGCCIFVPEELEGIQNGVYVPEYLLNHFVHLFGVFRQRKNKEQRMGLVVAFEARSTDDNDDRLYLACNSLELSRVGISGGRQTVQKIVDYAEEWLIGYAKAQGYAGAVMGGHSYNTSENFSSRKSDILEEQLEVTLVGAPFYSDILTWKKDDSFMRTREDSCYWLWKADKKE
jgi:hypothetical protein